MLVSHDRYLLQRVCTKILAIDDRRINTYLGGFSDFETAQARAARPSPEGSGAGSSSAGPLVLQNRLAVLSARLDELGQDHPDYQATTDEFIATARELRQVQAGSGGEGGVGAGGKRRRC